MTTQHKFATKNIRRREASKDAKAQPDGPRRYQHSRDLRRGTITPEGTTVGAFGSLKAPDFNERVFGTTGSERVGKGGEADE